MRQTSPSFLYLLGDQSNFDVTETESLFGRTFVRSMVRSADTQAKLGNLFRGGHFSREGHSFRNGGNFRSKESYFSNQVGGNGNGRGDHNLHSYGGHSSKYDSRGGENSSRQDGQPKFHPANGFGGVNGRNGYVSSESFSSICLLQNWGKVESDKKEWERISNGVGSGFRIDFVYEPTQAFELPNMQLNGPHFDICNKEVSDLI